MKTYKKIVQSDIAPDKNELWLHDNILKKWTSNGWIPIAGGGDVESDEDHIKTYRTIIGRFADKQWETDGTFRDTIPDDWNFTYHGKVYSSPTQEFEIVLDEDFVVDEPHMFTGDHYTGDPASDSIWKPWFDYIIFPKGKVIGNVWNFFGYQFLCRLVDYSKLDFKECIWWGWIDNEIIAYNRPYEITSTELPHAYSTDDTDRAVIKQPDFSTIDFSNLEKGVFFYVYSANDPFSPVDKVYPKLMSLLECICNYNGTIQVDRIVAPNAYRLWLDRLRWKDRTKLDFTHFRLPPNITSLESFLNGISEEKLQNTIGIETILDWDISNVTNLKEAFSNYRLDAVMRPWNHWDTSKVKIMKQLFDGYKASTVDLTNLRTDSAEDMSFMFWNSKELTELDLSPLDMTTTPRKNMVGFFGHDHNLTTVHFGPNFDMSQCIVSTDEYLGLGWVNMPKLTTLTGNLKLSPHADFYIHECPNLDLDSIMLVINALPEVDVARKFRIKRAQYVKLSEETIATIVSKGWTIVIKK